MNTKGQVDDVFDFMFMAFVLVFMFIFLGVILGNGAKAADNEVLKKLSVVTNVDELIHVNSFALQHSQDVDFVKMADRERSIREFVPGFGADTFQRAEEKTIGEFGKT